MIFATQKKSLMAIAMSAFITKTEAQATCTLSSLDCCWVVRSWQLMGQTTTVSSNSSTGCCEMPGVKCSGSNVTGINWTNQNLAGSIPPEIGNLLNLIWLDLSQNQLSGQITKELGKLNSLGLLSLNKNQLSGPIPPELGNIQNLKYLDLSQNQLSGTIPKEIGNLSLLHTLILNDNQLSLPIPSEIKKIDTLSLISLTGNKFDYNDIPADIREWISSKTETPYRELFPAWPFHLGLGLGFLCLGIIGIMVYYAKMRMAQGTVQHQNEPT